MTSKKGDIPSEIRAVGLSSAFILNTYMAAAKNVYALMLALVIVLSGCFGNSAPDADGQQSANTNANVAPMIEIGDWATESGEWNATHWNVSVYRAMTDIDGLITSAGWDFDLDGTIDFISTSPRSIDQLSIPANNWLNHSTIDGINDDTKITTISFIAIDEDGDSSGQLITIDTTTNPYWPAGATRNSYTAEDASASTSAATDDLLMQVRWQHAEDDLNWAFVVIKLSVGDSTYDCSTAGDVECSIGQDGSDDAMWETGEFLTLSESGSDIANGATTISLYVTYRGTTIAGDSSVTVS